MSALKKSIDHKLLENELHEALKADELYNLQNDAKLRAIEQKVPTYDNFKDMVDAAHLKPVEKSDWKKKSEASWNKGLMQSKDEDAHDSSANSSQHSKTKEIPKNVSLDKTPKNVTEFLEIWNLLEADPKKRMEFLQHNKTSLLRYFQAEVPSKFLEEVITVLLRHEDDSEIVEILDILKDCKRFSLNLAMMSRLSKINSKLLMNKLYPSATLFSEEWFEQVDNLRKHYEID